MDADLHGVVCFLTSRAFAVNFVANLGGAMGRVLLAFWIERFRARRETKMVYGRILRTSHTELAYLKPMCEHRRDALRAGQSAGTVDSFAVPATRALLINPVVHEQAPYSLIMAITILCGFLDAAESAFREARRLNLLAHEHMSKTLGDQLEKVTSLIAITLEQLDLQLELLRLKKVPDTATQEVSQGLREVLQNSPPSLAGQNSNPNQEGPR
jgi:hypothetical protein